MKKKKDFEERETVLGPDREFIVWSPTMRVPLGEPITGEAAAMELAESIVRKMNAKDALHDVFIAKVVRRISQGPRGEIQDIVRNPGGLDVREAEAK